MPFPSLPSVHSSTLGDIAELNENENEDKQQQNEKLSNGVSNLPITTTTLATTADGMKQVVLIMLIIWIE